MNITSYDEFCNWHQEHYPEYRFPHLCEIFRQTNITQGPVDWDLARRSYENMYSDFARYGTN